MGSIYKYLPFTCQQANLICDSLSKLIGLNEDNHDALVQDYWQKILAAAIKTQVAIQLNEIETTKQKRAGQKLKRIAQTQYPRYRHDTEIMALLFMGALRKGYIRKPPKIMNEEKYRSILFELSSAELRESAAEAYNAALTSESTIPLISLDTGGRPNGHHFLDYAKSILAIYKSASISNHVKPNVLGINDLTNVVFLEQCLSPTIFTNHPFVSTASMIENASI